MQWLIFVEQRFTFVKFQIYIFFLVKIYFTQFAHKFEFYSIFWRIFVMVCLSSFILTC
jgi:hypothetical protein